MKQRPMTRMEELTLSLASGAACLLGVLSVLERRQLYAIVQRLEQARDGAAGRVTDG